MEHQHLIQAFVKHEQLRGMKSLRKIPYLLRPFFTYLRDYALTLDQVSRRDAQEYQSALSVQLRSDGLPRYASSSISDMINCVIHFYSWLKEENLVYQNPFSGLKRIKRHTRLPRGVPREEQLEQLLHWLRSFPAVPRLWDRRALYRVHVLAELQYATGLRISELAGLTVQDIDLVSRTVRVRQAKGGRERTAYLTDYASGVLDQFIQKMRGVVLRNPESDFLFGCKSGRTLEYGVNKRLKEAAKACGLERFTSHGFRHALGFHLLRHGCDLRYIQLILGHEDMNSTTLYTKVEQQDLRNELDRCHPRRIGAA